MAAPERVAGDNLDLGANAELAEAGAPRFYVILNHVSKKHNVGTLLRSACAFGVREVLVAGSKKNTQYFGAQGTHKHVPVTYFDQLDAAVAYAREKGCDICGVEIKPEAKSILDKPFAAGRSVAFILGNEGQGLSEKQCAVCDSFVYIPHYGDGTASLNVSVAASIVFQHFASWAAYPERAREGEKFVVKDLPVKRGATTAEDLAKQEHRRRKREKATAVAEAEAGAEASAKPAASDA